jgi:hypothetical protein
LILVSLKAQLVQLELQGQLGQLVLLALQGQLEPLQRLQ